MLNAAQYPTGAAKPWLTGRYFYSFMLCAKPHVLHKYGLKGFMCTSRAIRGMLCTHCSHTPPITLLLATHSTPTASLKVPCIPPKCQTLVRPGSQTQKCSCCHLTSHTHSAILPTAQRPFCLSVRVRERARLSSHCPHAHAIPWSRGEGERARARGSLTHACRGGRMRTGSTRRLAPCSRWSGML